MRKPVFNSDRELHRVSRTTQENFPESSCWDVYRVAPGLYNVEVSTDNLFRKYRVALTETQRTIQFERHDN